MAIADSWIERIHPTENDISLVPYSGINASEFNFSNLIKNSSYANCVLPSLDGTGKETSEGGFKVIINDPLALTVFVSIAGSRAYINGRYVEIRDSGGVPPLDSYTMTDDKDNYIFLTMSITNGKVNLGNALDIINEVVDHDTQPQYLPNSILLGVVRVESGNITIIKDLRASGPIKQSCPFFSNVIGQSGVVNGSWSHISIPNIRDSITVGGGLAVGITGNSGNISGDVKFKLKLEVEGAFSSEIVLGDYGEHILDMGSGINYYDSVGIIVYDSFSIENLKGFYIGDIERARIVLDIVQFNRITSAPLSLTVQTDDLLPVAELVDIANFTGTGWSAKSFKLLSDWTV